MLKEANVYFFETADYYLKCWLKLKTSAGDKIVRENDITIIHFQSEVGGCPIGCFISGIDIKRAIHEIAQSQLPEPHWIISFIPTEHVKPTIHKQFQKAGYHYIYTDQLMRLDTLPPINEEIKLIKVTETEELSMLNQSLDREMPSKLNDEVRTYYIMDNNQAVSAGVMILHQQVATINQVYTPPSLRGKGYAKALCKGMLNEANKLGIKTCILSATEMGYPLYLSLGFKDIGQVLIYQRGN